VLNVASTPAIVVSSSVIVIGLSSLAAGHATAHNHTVATTLSVCRSKSHDQEKSAKTPAK
jgi:hypothetical protein